MTTPQGQSWVAVVTGAAQGIGEAVARRLATDGAAVALLDIDTDKGPCVADALTRAGHTAMFIATDVGDAAQVADAVDTAVSAFGRLDALVNNAGINAYFDAVSMTEQNWDDVFAVDLKGAWLLCRAALPHLMNSDRAAIVNISSIHSRLTTAGMFPYAAAKSAIEGLTRSLALDYASRGVRVNAVAPGWTRTALVQEWLERQPDPTTALDAVTSVHPLGYIAEPEDVASVVAFLLRPEARAVTGAVYAVDCGLSARFAT
jgi:NAD(P)-dependent dehydrogenase (short-subunit alcohol dehydrogenase family)